MRRHRKAPVPAGARWLLLAAAVLPSAASCTGGSAAEPAPPAPPDALTARIPPRAADAPTGSAFLRSLEGLSREEREQAILREVSSGNVPSFLRRLKPVVLGHRTAEGRRIRAVVWVMPDYLAVGSDEDYVRVPMGLPTATAVARRFDFALPTRKMVDAIHRQAEVRLRPEPMKPGPRMTSTEYFRAHNGAIERQLGDRDPGALVSGHKKDLVMTNRLTRVSRRVAIYGWHRRSGEPIQPLSTVHGARYADYSHGVRLVGATVLVDGRQRSMFDVLEDPRLARVLSYEGTIRGARALIGGDPSAGAGSGD